MNNQNESDKEPDRQPESEWAEIIEQQGQPLKPDSQSAIPFSMADLDSQKVQDLQIDGQLRMLHRLSASGDSFVDDVVARAEVVSSPSSESNSSSDSQPRLPVIAPVFASSTPRTKASSEATPNSGATPPNKAAANNVPPGHTSDESDLTVVAERKFAASKAVATLASIAAAIAVAFMIWSGAGEDHPTPQTSIPASPSNQNLANRPLKKTPDESRAHSNDSIELIEPAPSAEDGLVDHANHNMAPTPDKKENHLHQPKSLVERPLKKPADLIDDKSTSRLADQPPKGTVEIVSDDPVPRLTWHLAIDFAENGVGSISLNEAPIDGSLLVDNADFVLRRLGDEFTRRAQFFGNRLGTQVAGSIRIGTSKFPFANINQVEQTIDQACQHFATLETSNLSLGELAELRQSFRQLTLKNPNAIASVDLNSQQTAFLTDDEIFTICSVLTTTESVLQNTAKLRLAWEARTGDQLPKTEPTKQSITPDAFASFASNGFLALPKTKTTTLTTLQKLPKDELKEALYTSIGSFDLFADIKEFHEAERNIATKALDFQKQVAKKLKTIAKAAPAERPKLAAEIIATIDRTELESKKYTLAKIPEARLPLTMGDECRSSRTEAAAIDRVSSTLGLAINLFDPSLGSRDPSNNDSFRIRELKKKFKTAIDNSIDPQRLKTSDQILQIDHPRMRLELIEALEKSKTDTALKLLAKRAKFDLVPEVRMAATTALAHFPHDQYRDELLAGLRYPWHVVAQHSAEALVRLGDEGAVAELVAMLDLPHPNAPVKINKNKYVQSELVAINHMRNCLLCHAPAASSHEMATGVVPSWGEPLPKQYYKSENPRLTSVRADVTYLEQDFSVVQPVWNSGPWPRNQRFDYVVQQKPVKGTKAKRLNKQFADARNQNREAIVFALQNLTGQTPSDNSAASWQAVLKRLEPKQAP